MFNVRVVASFFAWCLAFANATLAAGAQTMPDVAIAIHGSDATIWATTAIGGRTIAGSYVMDNKARNMPDQGAFTWDGSTLHVYPRIVFTTAIDQRPDNVVFAVNAAGVAVGANKISMMSSSGSVESDIATRFQDGNTMLFASNVGLGLNHATAVDPAGDIVGSTADGQGFYVDAHMARSAIAGLTSTALNANVAPSAIDSHGNVAGTSTTLQTFGNRFDAPNPLEPHVFLARAGELGAPARDLGGVPHCHSPSVAGLSDDGTIAGTCTADAAPNTTMAWEWNGTFRLLPALPGDDSSHASGVSADGAIVGASVHGNRTTAVVWRDGKVSPVSTLAPAPNGAVFEDAIGMTSRAWILVSGHIGTTPTEFLVVPAADSAAASTAATLPAGPAPTASDPPIPAENGNGSNATAIPVAPRAVATVNAPVPALRVRWSGALAAPPVTDGKRLYVATTQSLEAFDGDGKLLWKHPFASAVHMAVTSGMLVTRGSASTLALDAATGASRWTVANAQSDNDAFAAGDGVVANANGKGVSVLDVATGRHVAQFSSADGDPSLCTLSEAGGTFGCEQEHQDYSFSLTMYDALTGRALLALPNPPVPMMAFGTEFLGLQTSSVLAVHPQRKTYDVVTFPHADVNRRAAFDGDNVVINDAGVGRRYRLDVDPKNQHPIAFPVDPLEFAASAGFVASFAAHTGPLTVVSFDAAGAPSEVAYDAVRASGDPNLALAGHLAFAITSNGVAVVDLARRRVLGRASVPCTYLDGIAVAGATAVIDCRVATSTGFVSRVDGIALAP